MPAQMQALQHLENFIWQPYSRYDYTVADEVLLRLL